MEGRAFWTGTTTLWLLPFLILSCIIRLTEPQCLTVGAPGFEAHTHISCLSPTLVKGLQCLPASPPPSLWSSAPASANTPEQATGLPKAQSQRTGQACSRPWNETVWLWREPAHLRNVESQGKQWRTFQNVSTLTTDREETGVMAGFLILPLPGLNPTEAPT